MVGRRLSVLAVAALALGLVLPGLALSPATGASSAVTGSPANLTVAATVPVADYLVPVKKKCGYVVVAGRPTYRYCGPAKVTAWVGADEYRVTKGKCFFDKKGNGYFTVQVGMNQLGAAAPTKSYADIVIFTTTVQDNTPLAGSFTLVVPGKRFAILEFAGTMNNGGTEGTVEAQTTDGTPVRATFTCT